MLVVTGSWNKIDPFLFIWEPLANRNSVTANSRSDIVRSRLWEVRIGLCFEQFIKLNKLHKKADYLSGEPHPRALFWIAFEISQKFIVAWWRGWRTEFSKISFSSISEWWASLGFKNRRKFVILVCRWRSKLNDGYWKEWLNLSDFGKLNCIFDFDVFSWFCSIYSTEFDRNAFFDTILFWAFDSLF